MSLEGKKVAILLEQVYEDLELWYPFYRLSEEGAEVFKVAPEANREYPSKHGYPATSDAAAKDVKGADFDAVIVPGGFSPDFMRRDQSMVDFINQCAEADIVLASICHGAWMLCCTDALKGRKATSFYAIQYDVRNAGAEWVDQEVCVDGKLITSRKPTDLPAFCKAILEALS